MLTKNDIIVLISSLTERIKRNIDNIRYSQLSDDFSLTDGFQEQIDTDRELITKLEIMLEVVC